MEKDREAGRDVDSVMQRPARPFLAAETSLQVFAGKPHRFTSMEGRYVRHL